MSVRALSPRGEDSCRCGWRVAPPGHCRPVRGSARSTLWGWGRQGRHRAERTRTSVRIFRTRVVHWCAWVPPKKATPSGAPRTCCCCNRCATRAQRNLIPTDHMQRHRLPGPKRFEPPVFALSPQSTFCIKVHVTAWSHDAATHRSRRPWRECVVGSFAAAAVRQGLGRASLRGDAER